MSSQSKLLNHPSHQHHLYLTNIQNSVLRHDCNACRQQINGFSYRCEGCNFDLHITCASKPLSLILQSHPHQLFLEFSPPYDNNLFYCGICREIMGFNHWLYRCDLCRFDAHLGCIHITPNIQQTQLQSYQTTPTAPTLGSQVIIDGSQFPTGPTPRPWPPLIYPAGPPNNYVNHRHGIVRPSGRGSGRGNNSVMNQASQGLIIGTAQSLAMYGVHTLLGVGAFPGTTNIYGGGSNAYGGNGGGGGDWGGDGGPFNYYGGNGGSDGDWGGDGGPFNYYGGNSGGDGDWGGDGGPSSDGGSF